MKLQLQHLRKQYGAKTAVDDVSVNLEPGVYGLLGANGAGKTTLMRMICGVLKPTSGTIRLDGKTIQALGEQYYTHLGYIMTSKYLWKEKSSCLYNYGFLYSFSLHNNRYFLM